MENSNIIPFPMALAGQDADGLQPISHGRIMSRDDDGYLVHLKDGRMLRARRSSGCLTVPSDGDLVLVYAAPGAAYILTILEQASGETTLGVDAPLRIQAPHVKLEGGRSLSMSAPDVDMQGVRGTVGFLNFSLTAGDMSAKIRKLTSFMEYARNKVQSLIQTVGDSLRRVESMETVEAARLRTKVDDSWTVKAGNATLRAENDVDIDGEHINLG
jgi:hypothetical protein